jgi:hypothetical protein
MAHGQIKHPEDKIELTFDKTIKLNPWTSISPKLFRNQELKVKT